MYLGVGPAWPHIFDSLASAAAAAPAPGAAAVEVLALALVAEALEALEFELAEMPSTFQAESCLTLDPPHPSCEKRASRTELSCSKCLEVDPLVVEAVDVVWV